VQLWAQYWEDYELWVCIEGMKEEKYIQIGQNICWNRRGSMILVRNSWKGILTPNAFFKTGFFDRLAILPANGLAQIVVIFNPFLLKSR
jgi:hypothetical protein